MIPTIETERFRLVPPDARHSEVYETFYTDPGASHHYGGPLTAAQSWSRLAQDIGHWQLRGFGVWVIESRENRTALGTCGFWQGLDWPAELTWWLSSEARGGGVATEASHAAIAHAYDGFGWTDVRTYMDDENDAARKLVERLGGVVTERSVFPDGPDRDIFSIPNSGSFAR